MKFVKKSLKWIIILCLIFLLFNLLLYGYCYITPSISITKNKSYNLYDTNNNLIIQNNDWIELDNISDNLVNATISVEDRYFYKHLGFDYLRILKAALKNIKSGTLGEGASTITQQYARNLFLNYEKTWSRKFEEAILAAEIETHYTKDEILEGYLNTINYGGVYGIEEASWFYFGHSASSLDLAEASILAGIPQSPSNYSPIINYDAAKKRQSVVLNSMLNNKCISQEEKDNAYSEELNLIGNSELEEYNNIYYFRDAVISELNSIDDLPNSLVKTGNLNIYTTFDKKAQESLENSINEHKNGESDIQISGMMMDSESGGVMAMIGGYDYSKSQFNRALYSKRQVGSIMKPILYYYALENGFTSSSCFTSEKTTFNFSNNNTYSPSNYNDKYAEGPITMATALAYSDNIYAVKTNIFLGEDGLVSMAKRLGISSNLEAIPSLALGTGEISMNEMVQAYSSFSNGGYKVSTHFINRIEDNEGNILYEYKDSENEILNNSLTYILSEMLTYTYDKDFIDYNYPTLINLAPKLSKKYAIKTGTTDTDMWIIGYNSKSVLSIWSGYDDNRVLTSNDTGIHKEIWADTMENYYKDSTDNLWYDIPSNVVGVQVNPINGSTNEDDENSNKKLFYYLKGTEPSSNNSYNYEEVFKEENK